MSEVQTARQRQTAPGRAAFAAKFTSPETKSQYYRQMAEKANAGRVTLSADDAEALSRAYDLLRSISHKFPTASPNEQPAPASDEPGEMDA